MAQIDQSKIQEAKRVVKEKIKEWYKNIRELRLEDLEPNIFLAGAIGIDKARDFIAFYVMQHVERSIVTSFGYLIEKVAKIIGPYVELCKKTDRPKNEPDKGWNLKVVKNGKEYYFEVKSGPHSCNRNMLTSINEEQENIKQEKPKAIVGLGIFYGKEEEVFSTIKQYYKGEITLVGKKFWEFISDDPDAYKKVLKLMIEAHNEVLQESLDKKTLLELMEEKINELTKEWCKKYGDKLDYNEMLKRFF